MITYQDYLKAEDKLKFIVSSISTYRRSEPYRIALDADEYDAQRNVTIIENIKRIYDITGVSVPDTISANNRIPCNFFHRLNSDRCSYLLGNGVSFPDKGQTKEALGQDFDTVLYRAAYYALIHGVSYFYVAGSQYYVFPMTEFLPLPDEESGAVKAGIRFWSLDWKKRPVYATLYEEDGFTRYRSKDGKPGLGKIEEIEPKRAYKLTVQIGPDGEEIVGQDNYAVLPIVPVYASYSRQSTLIGMRPNIDAYDMIHSGFANDLQDCAQIYWLIGNAMGMDDADVAKLRDRLLFQHMAVVDDQNSTITGYTHEVPYAARTACLTAIRNQIYEDFAALDVHTIAAGATNDHIDAAYQPVDEEADRFEYEIIKVVQQIEVIMGLEPLVPQFKRNRISNQMEQAQMVALEAQWLDDETILKKLPNITVDEVSEILAKKDFENAERFNVDDFSTDDETEEQE